MKQLTDEVFAQVKEALRPFAEDAKYIHMDWSDERMRASLTQNTPLTVRHFRKAGEALAALDAAQPVQVNAMLVEDVNSEIVKRYKVEKTKGGFWPYCVKAGDGAMELFIGSRKQVDHVQQALQSACLDGAFMAITAAKQAQPEPTSVYRLTKKEGGVWLPASEWLTGYPDPSWSELVKAHPELWSVQRRVTGKQIADGFAKAIGQQAQPARPINCGTGHCSCIECPYGQAQPEPEVNAMLLEALEAAEKLEHAALVALSEATYELKVGNTYTTATDTYKANNELIHRLDKILNLQYRDRKREARLAARQAQPERAPLSCTWTQEDDFDTPGVYHTSCGEMWSFTEGGIKENNTKFCPHCGGGIKQGGQHD